MPLPEFITSNTLYRDYVHRRSPAITFLGGSTGKDVRPMIDDIGRHPEMGRAMEALIRQNEGSGDASVARQLERMQDGRPVMCVVTGQQAGLMVSPLYVVYKTLTAIKETARLNKIYPDVCFVPVFWLEGEDHDFEEVRSFTILDKSGDIRRFSAEEEAPEAYSINKRRLPARFDDLLFELKEALTPTEFSVPLFKELQKIYVSGRPWLEAFRDHLGGLFHGKGLLMFDAGQPEVKRLSRPFFEKIVTENEELVTRFEQGAEALLAAGYPVQVPVLPNRAYLFLSWRGEARLAMERDGTRIVHRPSGLSLTREETTRLLDKHPEWFSSTVLTRPLWQSFLLSTFSYVAGPAEIAYWAQLKPAFEYMGLIMPEVTPRHSVTLLEPRVAKLIRRLGVDPLNIPADKDAFVKHYHKNDALPELKHYFDVWLEKNREDEQNLLKQISVLDPTLRGPVSKSFYRNRQIMEKLHNRLVRRAMEKNNKLTDQLRHIHTALMPAGPQERVLSAVYFQNKYGTHWLDRLMETLPDQFEKHAFVEI
ncbi:MAG: bacillithiol biosynthesis cysteine-adding enzyme BshC [Calditrichaeota bacterium]|nr:MAG: bacillithiol biosynthesis cysteine-adding enzyme BshC [Calditrichota bacterium]